MADDLFKEPEGDPTIAAAMKALEAKQSSRGHSRRIGGSSVGDDCLRKGWYSFRWTSPVVIGAKGLLAINDGYRGEDVMADMLKAVGGDFQLWTEDPENPGKQISFTLVDGHFVGKLDGIILGLLQAPKTPHVWEGKVINEKKFNKLKKDVEKFGEKNALEQWDGKYFAQAQSYMRGMGLTRHYLTAATPGVRDMIGVRTEYQPKMADMYEERAKRIAYEPRIPVKMSKDPAFFGCKFCDHADTCHGSKLPLINCRTCTHATAVNDGTWTCEKFGVTTDYEAQQAACKHHRFHPDLVPGEAVVVGENDTVAYKLLDGSGFRDDDKADRPPAPMIKMAFPAPQPGDWYCTGCGVLYSSPTTDLQCDNCSGALEKAV